MSCNNYQWDGKWAGIDNDKVTSKPMCKHCSCPYQDHYKVRS